jgi:hypothetical protein
MVADIAGKAPDSEVSEPRMIRDRATSSSVEHLVDIEGVAGSIPASPTISTRPPDYKTSWHSCPWCLTKHNLQDKSTWCALWVDAHSPPEAPPQRFGDDTTDGTANKGLK